MIGIAGYASVNTVTRRDGGGRHPHPPQQLDRGGRCGRSPPAARTPSGSSRWRRRSASPRAASTGTSTTAARCSTRCSTRWERREHRRGDRARRGARAATRGPGCGGCSRSPPRRDASCCTIDLAVRDWARRDQAVAARLRRVDNRRMDTCARCSAPSAPTRTTSRPAACSPSRCSIGNHFIAADHGARSRADVLELAMERMSSIRRLSTRRRRAAVAGSRRDHRAPPGRSAAAGRTARSRTGAPAAPARRPFALDALDHLVDARALPGVEHPVAQGAGRRTASRSRPWRRPSASASGSIRTASGPPGGRAPQARLDPAIGRGAGHCHLSIRYRMDYVMSASNTPPERPGGSTSSPGDFRGGRLGAADARQPGRLPP